MIGQRSTGRVGSTVERALKLATILRNPRFRRGLLTARVAASTEHSRVPFGDAATVIDVGANGGQFVLFALERFPQATVHAIEPHPGAFARLLGAVGTDPRVRLYPTAVGRESTETTLFLSQEDDSSSLLPVGEIYLATWPETFTVGLQPVQVERLDVVVQCETLVPPAMLKIDVQGTELQVLEGAVGLFEYIDEVFVECSFLELYRTQALADEVIVFMRSHGYRLAGTYTAAYNTAGACLQADLLFRRQRTPDR